MRKSTFTIGFNDKDAKRQIMSDEKITETIIKAVSEYYDGATFSESRGIYRGMIEKSLRVEVLDAEEPRDMLLMNELLKALNQESIAYEVAEVNAIFYEG